MPLSNEIKKAVKASALRSLKWMNNINPQESNLIVLNEVVTPSKEIVIPGVEERCRVEQDSVIVLADLEPYRNWGHPVKYLFHDAVRGKLYKTEFEYFPPVDFFTNESIFEPIYTPIQPPQEEELEIVPIPSVTRALNNAKGERYAILFSGMSDNRHVNDLEFLYRVLVDVYKFNPANITVLNHDGTINYFGSPKPVGNWPGDNTPYKMTVNGQGTKAEFESAISQVRNKLKRDDFLLIHTNNHGAGPTRYRESWICCYSNWDQYWSSDFGTKLGTLPEFASLMVMMEQCNSGGFMVPVINNSTARNTSFAAAAQEDRSSMGGPNFDPFARDWIAAMNSHYPDGSPLRRPVPTSTSAYDAFTYANAVKDPYDTPVYDDDPNGCGGSMYLEVVVPAVATP